MEYHQALDRTVKRPDRSKSDNLEDDFYLEFQCVGKVKGFFDEKDLL